MGLLVLERHATYNVSGCTKHVKKQGKYSAHGPKRMSCEADGCNKAAIQGGKCVGHGGKKKRCSAENNLSQAVCVGSTLKITTATGLEEKKKKCEE